jgi:hypothetical protein
MHKNASDQASGIIIRTGRWCLKQKINTAILLIYSFWSQNNSISRVVLSQIILSLPNF